MFVAFLPVVTVVTQCSPSPSGPAATTLTSADFLDTVGINTHLSFTDTAYGNRAILVQRLKELGITHIRDGWNPGVTETTAFFRDRVAPMGIKLTFIASPRDGSVAQFQHLFDTDVLRGLEAVESLNEWDANGGAKWAAEARSWTIALSTSVKADSKTRTTPIVAPSLAATVTPAFAELGDLSQHVDFGNLHNYAGPPLVFGRKKIEQAVDNAGIVARSRPVITTETGYSTGKTQKLPTDASDEQVAALLPRMLFEQYAAGIRRTFIYQLMDLWPENRKDGGYGLLKADGSPRLAYTSVKALLDLVRGHGNGCVRQTCSPLKYQFTNGDSDTRTVLLQEGPHRYHLALWQDVAPGGASHPVHVQFDQSVKNVTATTFGVGPQITGLWPKATTIDLPSRPQLTILTIDT
jgi:hypothetical protein